MPYLESNPEKSTTVTTAISTALFLPSSRLGLCFHASRTGCIHASKLCFKVGKVTATRKVHEHTNSLLSFIILYQFASIPEVRCTLAETRRHSGQFRATYSKCHINLDRCIGKCIGKCGEASRVPTNDTMSEATLKNSTAEATCAKGHALWSCHVMKVLPLAMARLWNSNREYFSILQCKLEDAARKGLGL